MLRPGLAILVQLRIRSEMLHRAVSYNVQETGDVNEKKTHPAPHPALTGLPPQCQRLLRYIAFLAALRR